MRCTKCHYLSFDPEPRCRNCGHDLSMEEGSAFSLANATLDGFSELGDSADSGESADGGDYVGATNSRESRVSDL